MMKRIIYTLLLMCIANVVMTGCSDSDSRYPKIYLQTYGLYVNDYGEQASTTFTTEYLADMWVSSYPDGWTVELSLPDAIVTVTAPLSTDSDIETEGTVYLKGEDKDGTSTSAVLYVGIVDYVDLDDVRANSMVISKPNTYYTFTPIMGEDPSQRVYADDYVFYWRTLGNPVNYLRIFDDGRLGFYAPEDSNDIDDDDDETDLIKGNVVIAALNSDDEVIWTWHLWVTDNDITTTTINGVEFMNRNLGAFDNCDDSEDEILDSHGLYYQWGRKDPFTYPLEYNAAGGDGAYIYSSTGSSLTYTIEDSDSDTGTLDYILEYPTNFILGTSSSSYDWLFAGNHDSTLWNGTTKSIYDPSPKGWRIPTSDEMGVLATVSATAGDYAVSFDGNLFMASGFRAYIDGSIHNLSSDGSYSPWSGYYWSSDANSSQFKSKAFHFYLNTSDNSVVVNSSEASYRANAMSIRPVRE